MRPSILAVGVLSVVVFASYAWATVYTGSLFYTPPAPPDASDGLYVSGGLWPTYTAMVSWTVTDEDTSRPGFPWKYTYTFGHNGSQSGISHVIIETSHTFTECDIEGLAGASISSIGEQTVTSGNSGMPSDVYGIRFEPTTESPFSMTWSFWSDRAPVWGDFYARGGNNQNQGVNLAYNYNQDSLGAEEGFLVADLDPAALPVSGSVRHHILVPDAVGRIPEPATMVLLALGGMGVLLRRR